MVEGIPSGFTLLVKIDLAKIGKFGKYGEAVEINWDSWVKEKKDLAIPFFEKPYLNLR